MNRKLVIHGVNRVCFSSLILCVTVASAAPGGNGTREPELLFPTTIAAHGDTTDARIEFRAKDSAISGIQFELEYDTNVFKVSATAGGALLAAGNVDRPAASLQAAVLHGRTRPFLA
jgi:hypothetical protein